MARWEGLPEFLDRIGYREDPMAVFYTDREPEGGFSPEAAILLTPERERSGEMSWRDGFMKWDCLVGKVMQARRAGGCAWFSAERFGCFGGAFYLGFNPRQPEASVNFVSTGIPGGPPGERYLDSPEAARSFFAALSPVPAGGRYCVFKPLGALGEDEDPELVVFFARPEVMGALHRLVMFVTNDPEGVRSPFGSACCDLVTMPRKYLQRGELRAVLGGWDCLCRRFFGADELSMSMPAPLLEKICARWKESCLITDVWEGCRKRIGLSEKAWKGAAPRA